MPSGPGRLPPEGTWLLFGGPYSNLRATRAVLNRGAALGIPPGRTLCTGDVAAYCAEPAEVAALLGASGVHVLRGNCEEQLAAAAPDCGCGFAPGTSCDRLSAGWYAHALSRLDPPWREWMGGLPPTMRLRCGPRTLLALHGAPGEVSRFVFPSEPDGSLAALLDAAGADGVVGGHCGLPFTRLLGGRAWHNPGAVGLPANDGTPRTWFSLLEPHPHALVFRHCALHYDHAAAAGAMRRNGMAIEYARALEDGMWPGLDVLPPGERGRTGLPLEEAAVVWAHPRRRHAAPGGRTARSEGDRRPVVRPASQPVQGRSPQAGPPLPPLPRGENLFPLQEDRMPDTSRPPDGISRPRRVTQAGCRRNDA